MEALFPCFSSSTTMRTEPEPRSTAQSIAYRGEAEEAVGIHPLAECHCYGRNIPTLLLPASVNHNVLLAPTTTPSGKLLLVGMA